MGMNLSPHLPTSGLLGIGDEVKVATISLQFLLSVLDNFSLPFSLWASLSAFNLKTPPDLLRREVMPGRFGRLSSSDGTRSRRNRYSLPTSG
jgi:hypothetical protein